MSELTFEQMQALALMRASLKTREAPTLEQMRRYIEAYYAKDGNAAGGSCHIVLDDYNIEKRHIIWCEGYCCGREDKDGAALMTLLLRMPEAQRWATVRGKR